jgi:hypothetical protein
MFENTPPRGPFPGIESSDDIHGNRRWVLGLLQGNSSTRVFQDFQNATYIECPKELRDINVRELEAWQEIGATALSDDQINSIGLYPELLFILSFSELLSLVFGY